MDNSIADARTADVAVEMATMPRFEDGCINLQELLRQLAESVVNEIMSAEADQLCEATHNSRNGYRERRLTTCVGTLTPGIPKLRIGSFFPDDVLERYQRVDRAIVAAVTETCATGTSTRKVQKIAGAMGIERLSKDQAGAIAASLDSEVEELLARPLGGLRMPYLWLDATYLKCRQEGRVASTAVVTAIGCDKSGWRHVLGLGIVDTESYDSWLAFLRKVRERGVDGVQLVTSDAHDGLRRAIQETFQGAAWQRCVVHIIRDCVREARSRQLRRRVARIVSPVFRAKDAEVVRAMYHLATEMPEGRAHTGGRRAGRAGLPRLPVLPLEAPAHQQRPGAREQGDKAQVEGGAGVPHGQVPGASRRRRHVRPGRRLAGVALLLGEEDGGAVRRAQEAGGGRPAVKGKGDGAEAHSKEGYRREPGAYGRARGGVR